MLTCSRNPGTEFIWAKFESDRTTCCRRVADSRAAFCRFRTCNVHLPPELAAGRCYSAENHKEERVRARTISGNDSTQESSRRGGRGRGMRARRWGNATGGCGQKRHMGRGGGGELSCGVGQQGGLHSDRAADEAKESGVDGGHDDVLHRAQLLRRLPRPLPLIHFHHICTACALASG